MRTPASKFRTASSWGRVWVQLIENNAMRERMGKAARELSERNRGATARSLKRIMEVIAQSERPSHDGAAANGVNAAEGNKKGSAA
jgi:hypothetical protein